MIFHVKQSKEGPKIDPTAAFSGAKRALFSRRFVSFAALRDWKCFDADSGKDLARDIREYFIPNFSGWEDNQVFESGFKKLLEALKKENDPQ